MWFLTDSFAIAKSDLYLFPLCGCVSFLFLKTLFLCKDILFLDTFVIICSIFSILLVSLKGTAVRVL